MDKPSMDKRTPPIRIVIADDHPIFRDGLRRLLESEGDMKVVGEACDGFEAVKLATEIKPDILLLDLAMPHHTGLDALRDLNTRVGGAGPVRIILLTAAAEKKQVVEALQLGARGVVLKDSATQLLLKSIGHRAPAARALLDPARRGRPQPLGLGHLAQQRMPVRGHRDQPVDRVPDARPARRRGVRASARGPAPAAGRSPPG